MATSRAFVQIVKWLFPSRFVAARLTRLPVVGSLVYRLMFDGDSMMVLPRARSIAVNQAIDPPDNMVLPSQVVDYFVEQARYHWIMNACICRDASHCHDYPIDLGCLFLGEAAMHINPHLGHRATRDEARDHVRRCREAGLVHLIGRNKIDTLWLGVGPGDRLLTICNCCPCCCLWRMLPYVAPGIGSRVSRMPGVRVAVSDRCVGCGTCVRSGVCFVQAIHMNGGQRRAEVSEACRGCGRCVDVCPERAIELSVDTLPAVEASVAHIARLVDVS